MQQIITRHNKKILTEHQQPQQPADTTRKCNCRKGNQCPMDGSCLSSGIIYQATVSKSDNDRKEIYLGLCDTTFKARLANHTASLKHSQKRHSTTLSHYIWQLKEKNINYNISWKIVRNCNGFSPSSNRCQLCLNEKYYILFHPDMATLNSRNELFSSCRHKKKKLLANTWRTIILQATKLIYIYNGKF